MRQQASARTVVAFLVAFISACSQAEAPKVERSNAPEPVLSSSTVSTQPSSAPIDVSVSAPIRPNAGDDAVATTTTQPSSSEDQAFTILAESPRSIEPIEPSENIWIRRSDRPEFPREPAEQWRVSSAATELVMAMYHADLVIVWVINGEDHAITARSQSDGSVVWTSTIADHTIGAARVVDGVILIEWLTPFYERFNSGIDAMTGTELWRTETEGAVISGPIITSRLANYLSIDDPDDALSATALDPRTLDEVGKFHRTTRGASGPIRLEGNALIELDQHTLEPIRSTVLDQVVSTYDSVTTTSSHVVAADDGIVYVFERDGALVDELDFELNSTIQLTSLGPDSDTIILSVTGEYAALDLVNRTFIWSRSDALSFDVLGLIDGEPHGLLTGGSIDAAGRYVPMPSELVSLETGETRCTVPGSAGLTRHGLASRETFYDLDCSAIWTSNGDDEVSRSAVDGGLLRWRPTDTGLDIRFYA